jgi:hypothetical protein
MPRCKALFFGIGETAVHNSGEPLLAWTLLTKRWWLLPLWCVLGTLAKETEGDLCSPVGRVCGRLVANGPPWRGAQARLRVPATMHCLCPRAESPQVAPSSRPRKCARTQRTSAQRFFGIPPSAFMRWRTVFAVFSREALSSPTRNAPSALLEPALVFHAANSEKRHDPLLTPCAN